MEKENMKIIETIKKVLELSQNNPSEEEAQAAALKAQELMAKYHMSMSDIDMKDDKINEIYVEIGTGHKWKYQLAHIVDRNFCCKHFLYGKDTIVFYGHDTDVRIASKVFCTLFYTGNKLAGIEYRDARARGEITNGLVNSYLSGYMAGIKSVLDAQCTALMIVVPKDVEDGFSAMTASMKHSTCRGINSVNNGAFGRGYQAGRSQMSARELESK